MPSLSRTNSLRLIGAATLILATASSALLYYHQRNGRWTFWKRRNTKSEVIPLFEAKDGMLRSGNPALKEVCITFDDGPHRESREQILATLKRYKAKATFFEVGMRMAQNPDLLRKTIAEGHEIANHTMYHQNLPGLKPDTLHKGINDADITYYRVTGKHLRILRPPGMKFDTASLKEAKRLGYIVVSYTAASADYGDNVDPAKVVDRTLRNTAPGGIILLHDYPATATALPEILEQLMKDGYHFVTVTEMIQHLPPKERQMALSLWNGVEERQQLPRPAFLMPSVASPDNAHPALPNTKPSHKGS